MLFHSWTFAVFFITVYAVYLCLRPTRFWVVWLLAASYVFYGWWNPLFLLLIFYTTTVDYVVGRFLVRTQHKKRWLAVSILSNVLVLAFFKYSGFAADNLTHLFQMLHIHWVVKNPGILLPVGISFFTFQGMSYTIDVYRGIIPAERNFLRFAAFVALFPQLVAGPIQKARDLLPQLRRKPPLTTSHVTEGLSLFVVGLFKKVALADLLASYVDQIYAKPAGYDGLTLLMATYGFAWQIYFDFSGYTDMARGCARMMGIDLTQNFNNPYLAESLRDFWRRWHISLSTWFMDYVYFPLGGNRRGKVRTYVNMVLTMLICGVWHGAAWKFLLWGALHAAGRCATRALETTRLYVERIPTVVKRLAVFHFVCFTWIFFRAKDASDALVVVKRIFTAGWTHAEAPAAAVVKGAVKLPPVSWTNAQVPLVAFGLVAAVWAYQWIYESRWRIVVHNPATRVGLIAAMLLMLLFFTSSGYEPFIYFQF